MLGQQNAAGNRATSPDRNRYFRYEVVGLRQNQETGNDTSPIRSSGSQFIVVPYGRMNDTMRRITRLGGTIVNITPVDSPVSAPEHQPEHHDEHQPEHHEG